MAVAVGGASYAMVAVAGAGAGAGPSVCWPSGPDSLCTLKWNGIAVV